MTKNINEISDIFSMFHDGRISKYTKFSNYSLLYIECMYLAERFDINFDHFILKIYNMENVELRTWPRDIKNEAYIINDSEKVFQSPLDIADSEIVNGKLIVRVGQEDDPTLDYSGGELSFKSLGIEIYDPNQNQILFQELVKISNQYWKDFSDR